MRKREGSQETKKDEEKGNLDQNAPQPFASGVVNNTAKTNDEQEMSGESRDSKHFASGNGSEKTLTVLEEIRRPEKPANPC